MTWHPGLLKDQIWVPICLLDHLFGLGCACVFCQSICLLATHLTYYSTRLIFVMLFYDWMLSVRLNTIPSLVIIAFSTHSPSLWTPAITCTCFQMNLCQTKCCYRLSRGMCALSFAASTLQCLPSSLLTLRISLSPFLFLFQLFPLQLLPLLFPMFKTQFPFHIICMSPVPSSSNSLCFFFHESTWFGLEACNGIRSCR